MTYMLPKSLAVMPSKHNLSYLSETPDEMLERLDKIRDRPIGEFIDRDVEVAGPDTPLIKALMLIKNKQYVVPVVDHNHKLIGAISFFSVLYGLNKNYTRDEVQSAKEREREERKKGDSQ